DRRASFNINYLRPHVFGLEAEIELSALVARFAPRIRDPQRDGMGDGPYTPEGFLRGWNAGNRFGCEAMAFGAGLQRPGLPAATLERVWRWNYAKDAYQERLATIELVPCFVPTVDIVRSVEPSELFTVVIWGDAMPLALPEVDAILIAAKPLRLLPRVGLV